MKFNTKRIFHLLPLIFDFLNLSLDINMNTHNSLCFESYRKKIVNVIQKLGTDDFYKFIGINWQATKDEINKAYKKKALQLHPDRNANEENYTELFKILVEVSKILLDDNIRNYYNNNYLSQKLTKIRTQNVIDLTNDDNNEKLSPYRFYNFQYPKENNSSTFTQTSTPGHSTSNNQVSSRLNTKSSHQRQQVEIPNFTKNKILIKFSDSSQQAWFSKLDLVKRKILNNYILNNIQDDSVEALLLELMRINPNFNYMPKLLNWSDKLNKWFFLDEQEFWLNYFEVAYRYENLVNAILVQCKKEDSTVIFKNLVTALFCYKKYAARNKMNFTKKLQFCNNIFTSLTKQLPHNEQIKFLVLCESMLDIKFSCKNNFALEFNVYKLTESKKIEQLVTWAKTKNFTVESYKFALHVLFFCLKKNLMCEVPSNFSTNQNEKPSANNLSSLNGSDNLKDNVDTEKENIAKTKFTNKLSIGFILDGKESSHVNNSSVFNNTNLRKRKNEEIDREINSPQKKFKFFSMTPDEFAKKITQKQNGKLQSEQKTQLTNKL